MTSLPASDPGSAAVRGSKRINPRPQSCLCLTWSGYPSNDDERFNKSCFKSRKVKRRATSRENRKFFVAVVKSAMGVVKKMLTNGGLMKMFWAYVGLTRAGKVLAVERGRRIGDGAVLLLVDNFFLFIYDRQVTTKSHQVEKRPKLSSFLPQ